MANVFRTLEGLGGGTTRRNEREKEKRLYLRYKDIVQEGQNAEYQYLDLDLINSVDLNYTSRITEYPMLENDIIADHMYSEPGVVTVSGSFSTSGKFSEIYGGTGTSRLENIQKAFEELKNRKMFIDIMSIYNVRERYLLQDINWVENANTLDYTFKFKQVHLATAPKEEFDIDLRDDNLPTISEPQTLDFTDEFLDKNEIIELVIQVLSELKVFDAEFWRNIGHSRLIARSGVAVATIIVLVAIKFSVIPGVGWIIGAGLLIGVGIAGIFKSIFKASNKYAIKQFRHYKNKKKNEAEHKRFLDFMDGIYEQIDVMEQTSKVYGLPNGGDQETFLNINGQYYGFEFTRNNSDNTYSLQVTNMEDKLEYSSSRLIGLSSLDECTDNNNIFADIPGSQVFIFNKNLMNVNAEEKSDQELYGDLRDYMILVTDIRLNEWADIIRDIVRNAVIG